MLQILIIHFKPPPFSQSQTSQIYKFLIELVCHQILPDKQRLQLFPLCFLFFESGCVGFIYFLSSGHNFIKLANPCLFKNNQIFHKVHLANLVFISSIDFDMILFFCNKDKFISDIGIPSLTNNCLSLTSVFRWDKNEASLSVKETL